MKNFPKSRIVKMTDDELDNIIDNAEDFTEATVTEVDAEIDRRAYDASDPAS
jgi:hypothetical protein